MGSFRCKGLVPSPQHQSSAERNTTCIRQSRLLSHGFGSCVEILSCFVAPGLGSRRRTPIQARGPGTAGHCALPSPASQFGFEGTRPAAKIAQEQAKARRLAVVAVAFATGAEIWFPGAVFL